MASKRRPKGKALDWSGKYGYGASLAHPSVQLVKCPRCKADPGKLCLGEQGPMFGCHVSRKEALKVLHRMEKNR